MRRYDALMAIAALVVAVDGAVVVLFTEYQALQGATTVLRLAAFAALWRTLPRAVHAPASWWPLASYAAGLFAVLGAATVGGVNVFLWPPTCTPTVPDYAVAEISVRILDALSAGLIVWAWWTTARALHGHTGRTVATITVAGAAALGAAACYSAATMLNYVTETHGWCQALSEQPLSSIHLFVESVLAGPNEEFVFTGLGLAMLMRARWPVIAAGLMVNVSFRLSIHLYYANQQTLLHWLAWVAIWSGMGLLFTLAIGRRAIACGMPIRRCVLACTVAVTVTHSLVDLL